MSSCRGGCAITAFEGLKMCFRQDELQWVDASNEILRQLGVHVLSPSPAPRARRLYGPNSTGWRSSTLTGYVPDDVAMRP